MIGALILAFVLIVVIPVGVLTGGGVLAGILGHLLKDDAESRHADSELLDLNL